MPRDYKAEYQRRIERGLERGLSLDSARGHAKPGEQTARQSRFESFVDRLQSTIKNVVDTIIQPVPPDMPYVPRQEPIESFGVQFIPEELRISSNGLKDMDIVVEVKLVDGSSIVRQFDARQYDDEDIIRRMVLARIPELDKQEIDEMYIWIDGDWYAEFDYDDFQFDDSDPDEEGDTP